MKEMSLKEIKKNFPALRQIMKGFNFALAYGGTAHTLAHNLNMPLDKAIDTERKYFQAFPGLRKYFETVKKETLKRGYILCDKIISRRSYYDGWEVFEDHRDFLEKLPDVKNTDSYFAGLSKGFWDYYTIHKRTESDIFQRHLRADVGKFFRIKGKLERDALNFPIQGTAASMTKLALVMLYQWIIDNGYRDIVKIVNCVHDK